MLGQYMIDPSHNKNPQTQQPLPVPWYAAGSGVESDVVVHPLPVEV